MSGKHPPLHVMHLMCNWSASSLFINITTSFTLRLSCTVSVTEGSQWCFLPLRKNTSFNAVSNLKLEFNSSEDFILLYMISGMLKVSPVKRWEKPFWSVGTLPATDALLTKCCYEILAGMSLKEHCSCSAGLKDIGNNNNSIKYISSLWEGHNHFVECHVHVKPALSVSPFDSLQNI